MKNKHTCESSATCTIRPINSVCSTTKSCFHINYHGYTIKPNDYPHPEYKYEYFHDDETDGFVNFCKTIDECKQEIDDMFEKYNFF